MKNLLCALFNCHAGTGWRVCIHCQMKRVKRIKQLRHRNRAAMLGNGEVLVTTGDDDHGNRVGIPEVYNPVTDTWRQLTSSNRTQQLYAFMYQLPNGKVY